MDYSYGSLINHTNGQGNNTNTSQLIGAKGGGFFPNLRAK